ncbi:surface lipoprotein assembly modifier [Pseudogemmobacter faecipullorum]|uniref:DUF560 domain-containing protein n=1 Tax=Pseudogemmobacter faecipullorum TaxID=2755041 RepID=A0ABS8CKL7_9RHOB|nr:surface lipoprotein assembly modifier [Pseudogemmobacter faecipullorum]MCB5409919.1 DUF560 domain-containing protein [Pseudogemmobacter faecipullorum]
MPWSLRPSRQPCRRFGLAGLLVLTLMSGLLPGVHPALAEPQPLTPEPGSASPEQLRGFGLALLQAGDLIGARRLADALLARDPQDSAALMLRAQAAALGGDERRARIDARAVWRLADAPGPKYGAAMMVAQSLAADGYLQRGQFWLRRAAQAAQSDQQKAAVATAFSSLRSRNPLIWQLKVSARPSSNVNDGSSARSFILPSDLFGDIELPVYPAQRALSGYEASAGLELTWRLRPTATTMTAFHLRFDQTKVALSSEAKAAVPGLKGSAFDQARLELGLSRRWRPAESKTTFTFGLAGLHDWSGGVSLANILRLSAAAERRFAPHLLGFASLSFDHQRRLDSEISSADTLALSAGMQRGLAGGDVVTLVLGLRDVASDSPGIRYDAASLRLGWRRARPVAGLGLEAWAGLEGRDYPDSPWRPDGGRQDLRASLDVTLELQKISWMGFSPLLNLSASRARSNAKLYESQSFGLELGFRSAF